MAVDLRILEYLHPFYVASDAADLDDAFAEGKQRAMRSLESKIRQVESATRADYEAAFFERTTVKDRLTVDQMTRHPENEGERNG